MNKFDRIAMNRNEYLSQLAQRQPKAIAATRSEAQARGSWVDSAVAAVLVTAALGLLASSFG